MLYLPRWCFQCRGFINGKTDSASTYLCRNCLKKLPFIKRSVCHKCGAEHPSEKCPEQWSGNISDFRAVFTHQYPVHQWIASLKYRRNLTAGRVLRSFLKKWISSNKDYLIGVDCLVPSPIHTLRLRSRGFNQTEYLLDKQKLPAVEGGLIKKIRHTPHQAGLSRADRLRSLKGAFKVVRHLDGKKVLLFDDVCASGGTIGEISEQLKLGGAKTVKVLVLSKAV